MKEHNCLIIAGEKSGEEHCLSFFKELKEQLPNFSFWGVGGDELRKAGLELEYHLNDFSSWGFSEVISKIPFYYRALDQIVSKAVKNKTKIAILVDFQGFNLKLAQKLKEKNIKVLYYVAPQAWVWKPWRAKTLAQTVHTLFTIIPFEKKWFKDRGVKQVASINHPLWNHYQNDLPFNREPKELASGFNLLVLPGSRNSEVKYLLPTFTEAALNLKKEFPNVKLSIVCSSSINKNFLEPYIDKYDEVYKNEELVEALKSADLCLATSGTVTLATALFSLPTLTCYRSSLLNEWIYRTFIKYEWFFGLANIVHNKEVSPELLQEEVSDFNLQAKLKDWINNRSRYLKTLEQLNKTVDLVKGDIEDVPRYLANIIKESYE